MVERLTDPKSSNRVDRGESPDDALTRVLAYYLDADAGTRSDTLPGHVAAIRGLIEADSTEVHVAGYLKGVERELGIPGKSRGLDGRLR